jgi:hypothetical protein
MSRVITFSRTYPSYHPKAGQSTLFVEKMLNSIYGVMGISVTYTMLQGLNPNLTSDNVYDFLCSIQRGNEELKHHTIRAGHRWKEGDWFSPRVWSGKPYNSKQIQFAPDIQIKKVWDFELTFDDLFFIGGELYAYSSSHDALEKLAENDGLQQADLLNWFNKPFEGQIICWNEGINY